MTTTAAGDRRYVLAQQLQADVRTVRCPGRNCGAPPGEPCRGAGGIGFHAPRAAEAFKAEFGRITGPAWDGTDRDDATPPPPRRRGERTGHRVLT